MPVVVFALLVAVAPAADGPAPRHGVAADLTTYAQDSPKTALASLLKAVEAKRVDYVLAQLADPAFVDGRVKAEAGGFPALVAEATDKLVADPGTVRLLKKLADEGTWDVQEETASVALKEGSDKSVSFTKGGGRWYVRNAYRPKTIKKGRN